MAVFLIQVNGGNCKEKKHCDTEAKYLWEEPIKYKVYINYNWKQWEEQKSVWKKIKFLFEKKGDKVLKVLIYCTGNVKPYPKQIRHIAIVAKVVIKEVPSDEKAEMHFEEIKELPSGVSLKTIKEKVKSGELSEGMKRCGQQGFNIGEVEESDLERILEWSGSTSNIYEVS